MKSFYYIIGILHIICFTIYRNIIPEINQDLKNYTKGKGHLKDFIFCLAKKEYRSVFYYRLPFLLRNILNLIF